MNSILRAFLAHWSLILLSTLACLLGGLLVITTSPPRYKGSARVVLDYIQPDPTTGQVVSSKMLDAYLTSQIRMLRDRKVAATAAEIMGWMDSPDVLSAYAARPASDTRDLPSWVAGILIPRIGAGMVEDSNILEISYFGESQEISRVAADALRTAYVQSDVSMRQSMAEENATRLEVRLAQVRSQLESLVAMQARISQETGVTLGPLGRDQASVQLATVLDKDRRPIIALPEKAVSSATRDLSQAREALVTAERSLGPNHPALLQLRARVEMLAARVAGEATSSQTERRLIDAANVASQAQVEALKSQVLAQRQPALRLKLLQDQIDGRKEEADNLARAVIASKAIQSTTSTSIVPVGEAVAEFKPVFPNRLLILGGTGGLGLILGGMIACLTEISARRVRNVRHIENATGVAVLAILPAFDRKRSRLWAGRRKQSMEFEATEASIP